jgi:hypothetical protein
MSDWRSISIVTETLRTLLYNGLKTDFDSVTVTSKSPDKARENSSNSNQLNLFLYHIAFNANRRNMDFPQKGKKAEIANPPLALDLFYLITAYAADNDDVMAHRILGRAMNIMNDRSVLKSEDLAKPPETDKEKFSPQLESIRIVPQLLTSDEVSKMWTAFQTPFRISAAYGISAVLVDSKIQRKVALPVRAYNIYAIQFRRPLIERISPQAAEIGDCIIIEGRNLKRENTKIVIGSLHIVPQIISETKVGAVLPEKAILPEDKDLIAGVNTVQVIEDQMMGTPPTLHKCMESNIAAFILIPKIIQIDPAEVQREKELTIKVSPKIGSQQKVSLIFNDLPLDVLPRSPTGPASSDTIAIPIPFDFPKGDYLLRIQVDGAESRLKINTDSTSSDFQKYIGPMVKVI